MKPFSVGLVALLAMAWAAAAAAEEVTLGVVGSTSYDTRAFRDGGRRENAFILGTGPRISIGEERERFDYEATYRALWQQPLKSGASDTWDHYGRLRGAWQLGPRTSLTFADSVTSTERANLFDQVDTVTGDLDTDTRVVRTTRNNANLELSHRLSPKWALQLGLNHDLIESDSNSRFDSSVIGGRAYASYQWTARHRFDLGFAGSYQNVQENQDEAGSRTVQLQLFTGWLWQMTSTLQFQVTGGPTAVRTRQGPIPNGGTVVPRFRLKGSSAGPFSLPSCDVKLDGNRLLEVTNGSTRGQCGKLITSGPNGEPIDQVLDLNEKVELDTANSDSNFRVSVFGEASLTKTWRDWSAVMSYLRREAPSTETGGSTSIDRAALTFRWDPAGDWSASLAGAYSHQESSSDVRVNPLGGGQIAVTAVDSGLLGLDTNGLVKPIAQADSLGTIQVDNSLKVDQWSLIGDLRRRIDENSAVSLRLSFQHQDRKGQSVSNPGKDNRFLARIQFEYDLDPFEF